MTMSTLTCTLSVCVDYISTYYYVWFYNCTLSNQVMEIQKLKKITVRNTGCINNIKCKTLYNNIYSYVRREIISTKNLENKINAGLKSV